MANENLTSANEEQPVEQVTPVENNEVAVTPAVDTPDNSPKEPVIVNDEIHHAPLDEDGNPIVEEKDEDKEDKDIPDPAPAPTEPNFKYEEPEKPEPSEAVKNATQNPNGIGNEWPRG